MPAPLVKTNARRSYGTGSLLIRTDSAGRELWYGKWRSNGRQAMRKIGPKRGGAVKEGLTRAQAEGELRRLIAEVRVTPAPGELLNVGEVARRYLVHSERRGRKPSTLRNVESEVRVHIAPFFGTKSLDAIGPGDVLDFVVMLEDGDLSPKSIRNVIGTLSALFNFAKAPQRRWASRNPCEGVELPAVEECVEIRFLTLEEVDALIDHARPGMFEAIDRAMYRTAAMTGLRQGELIALRWMDVDWPSSRIRVRQNYVLGEFGTPK